MKRYYRFILFFLAITLLFSLVVSLNACFVIEDSLDDNSTEENSPSVDDNTTVNPDNTTSEDEKPPVDDTPTEDITPTPEVIDFSKMSYLAFGDSITAGSRSYPNKAGALLGLELTSNRAVGGSTFAKDPNKEIRRCIANDVVEFASKSSVSYDIISVAGGVNDKALSLPLGDIDDSTNETIYGSLNIIVQAVQNKWPDAFFFLITPLKYPRYNEVNDSGYVLLDVTNAIKAVGEKYGVPVLDLYTTSGFETASNGMNHPDCDGWHPLEGFVDEYLAPQVADFIRKNYKNQ